MTTQQITENKQGVSGISKYLLVIALVALPVAAALYTNGLDIQQVPTVLTSGVFQIGLTLFSWALATTQVIKLKSK